MKFLNSIILDFKVLSRIEELKNFFLLPEILATGIIHQARMKFSNSLILDSKVFYQELKNLRILFVLKEKNSLIL
mgnify:CR=1 FL=1